MPELPEVQTIIDDLIVNRIIGQSIKSVHLDWDGMLVNLVNKSINTFLKKTKILNISRRGKYIVFVLSDCKYLIFHLRMTGKLFIVEEAKKKDKHEHFIMNFINSKSLRFHDVRKFGKIYLTFDTDIVLAKLGYEPLEKTFNIKSLNELLFHHKRALKPFLLDQKNIAGLGNIYVDEALWYAKLHPARISNSLTPNEVKLLVFSIKRVLRKGLKNFGTTLGGGIGNFYSAGSKRGGNSDKLKVFQRTGLECDRCKTIIVKTVIAQRGTHFCPKCQKL